MNALPDRHRRLAIILPLAVLCGAGTGYLAARWRTGNAPASSASAAATALAFASGGSMNSAPPSPPGREMKDKMRTLYEDIAQGKIIDWKAALDSAKAAGDPPLRAILIGLWADQDPLAARRWAEQAERFQLRPAPLTKIIAETWARKDPLAAMKGFVETLYELPIPAWAIFDIAARQDMATAKKLVAAYPEIFTTMGFFDPPENLSAAAEAFSALPAGGKRLDGMVELMEEWTAVDEKRAWAWWNSEASAGLRAELKTNLPLLLGRGSFLPGSFTPAEIVGIENTIAGDPDRLEALRRIVKSNEARKAAGAP